MSRTQAQFAIVVSIVFKGGQSLLDKQTVAPAEIPEALKVESWYTLC
jgi:hypothetical protein